MEIYLPVCLRLYGYVLDVRYRLEILRPKFSEHHRRAGYAALHNRVLVQILYLSDPLRTLHSVHCAIDQ